MVANKASGKPSLKQIGLSEETLQGLFTNLLKTRMLDERFRKLFRQGRFAGTYFSAVGQEATTVGPTYGLRDEDIIAPVYLLHFFRSNIGEYRRGLRQVPFVDVIFQSLQDLWILFLPNDGEMDVMGSCDLLHCFQQK